MGSARFFCAGAAELSAQGVSRLRLSPHTVNMVEVARIYRNMLDGVDDPDSARFQLSCLDLPGKMVDGFLHGAAGARAPEVLQQWPT